MTKHSKLSKNQHYVPKFLLRNFAFNKDEQIYVFDKQTERVFSTNIRNVASEQKYYDFEIDDYLFTLEPALSDIESKASEIIRRLSNSQNINMISQEEKITLSTFIAIQIHRGKQVRQNLIDMNNILEQRLREWGIDPKDVENFEPIDEDGAKKVAISLVSNYQELVPYIYDKWWLLFRTPKTRPFYISDNPVVMQNMYDYSPRGSLGLAVKGIEIYFPLSKTVTLGLYCRSHEKLVRDNIAKIELHMKFDKINDTESKNVVSYHSLKRLWKSLYSGCALQTNNQNLINLNSLQVGFAFRFIFSSNNDFTLAQQMIKDHPKLKQGGHIIKTYS